MPQRLRPRTFGRTLHAGAGHITNISRTTTTIFAPPILHVLADALTSILAIFALLAGKYYGAGWLGSFGLIGDSARVLLDTQPSEIDAEQLRNSIEAGTTDRVTDLHVWSIGHGINAAAIVLVSDEPASPDTYRSRIPGEMNIVHATVEVHACSAHRGAGERAHENHR